MKAIMLSCLLALAACTASHEQFIVDGKVHDPGGHFGAYVNRVAALENQEKRIPLTGMYSSSAVLYLRVASCVAPDAEFRVHEVRTVSLHDFLTGATDSYANGVRNEVATQRFATLMPACVRRLFRREKALETDILQNFLGAEILQHCPHIPRC